ncbi:cytochrome b-c1 complex subunit 9-like [Tubulanus polymorphus]|uniref:cytochrome b-c1 complex subunit 9-like n=1 Tax=Tubulanus polymorphus TaxID=672921 RepID=UPI003DA41FA3
MSFIQNIYKAVFRRSSTLALSVVAGVFLFERGVDVGGDYIWNSINRGKLWEHIKDNYAKKEEDDDE